MPFSRWRKLNLSVRQLFIALVTAGLLMGCVAGVPRDPLEVWRDRERGPEQRIAAANHLVAGEAGQALAFRQALQRIAWSDREPLAVRTYAMDRLLADDPAFFWASADRYITLVEQWPAMEHLFALAVGRGHQPFTRTAIRSYARPSQRYADKDRPERQVIASLHPEVPVEQVVFDVLEGQASSAGPGHQLAAWVLLCRVMPQPQLHAKVLASTASTRLISDLQAGGRLLDVWPTTAEEVLWLHLMRTEEGWLEIEQIVAGLTPGQRSGLAVRHLRILAARRADPPRHAVPESFIRRQHVDRDKAGVRTQTLVSQRWEDHADRLAWADIWVIGHLLDLLADPALSQALFRQADADLADPTTEYGGVLRLGTPRDPHHAATLFKPLLRRHDHVYYAPRPCIEAMRRGLAHYHFHAQSYDNASYAGPGAGDLAFARRQGANCVVFTFVDRNTLNVDYYNPQGMVIDLGCLYR